MERLNEIIAEQASRITLDFPVSFEVFEGWTVGKQEIGGYQYDSSIQRLIITADGGPVHEHTASAMYSWLHALAQRNNRVRANLAPCKPTRNRSNAVTAFLILPQALRPNCRAQLTLLHRPNYT
jgi:hypothetical protein